MMPAPVNFRFDAALHEYTDLDTGEVLPHITGMLERAGLVDDTWMTEASRERGTAVHTLTAAYDLEALDVAQCDSRYRGWLLGHVKVMTILRPQILTVEQADVHSQYRFGGRPDRGIRLNGVRGVWEIKSGDEERAHQVQTALQAILEAQHCDLPPWALGRWCCYLKGTGKYKVVEHKSRKDFDAAMEVIKRCCR